MLCWSRAVVLSLTAAGVALLLRWAGPAPVVIEASLRHPQASVDALGADVVAATLAALAGWIALGWLALALALVAASMIPGAAGGLARWLTAVTVPLPLRQLLAVAMGASLAGIATGGVVGTGVANASDAPLAREAAPHGVPLMNLDWPTVRHPAVAPAVIVRPGDTLWSIAAHRLPPDADDADVAAAWPRWYAANRQVIGDDPGLLRPGERLTVPGSG